VTPPRSLELDIAAGAAAPSRAPAASPPAAPGRGEIEVLRGADGRSRVARAYATNPLRLLTPVNHGSAAWIYMSSYGGGLVDDDAVSLDVTVGEGATAFVSTQASTKVYRSVRGSRTATRARVAPGGLLVFAPDPVVCYAAAQYRQTQQFVLDDDGALVLVDWVTSGRRAAGERWQFDEYDARTELQIGSSPALYDRLLLRAADAALSARMGRFDVLALVVVAGRSVASEAARIVDDAAARPLGRQSPLLMSAAALRQGGCAVRIAGRSTEDVGAAIAGILSFVPSRLGDDPWARKW
jgi:urease accessory protein